MSDAKIECSYRLKGNRFYAACKEYGIELGPFIDRQQAEDAIVLAVAKEQGFRVATMPCFYHAATVQE